MNLDGTASATQDEFLELFNTGADPVSLAGWSLSDSLSQRHLFDAADILEPDQFLVVFGGGNPTGLTNAETASSGTLSLNNTGDSVFLRDASLALIDSYSYSTSTAGRSMTRFPDGTGSFVNHSTVSSLPYSPGKTTDGSAQLPIIPEPTPLLLLGLGLVISAGRIRSI